MLDMSVNKDLWDVSFTDNSYLEVPFFFSIYSLMIEFNKYGPIKHSNPSVTKLATLLNLFRKGI